MSGQIFLRVGCHSYHKSLKTVNGRINMMREDMIKLNENLERLTLNGFFENYKELRDSYEYLADKSLRFKNAYNRPCLWRNSTY